MSIVAPLVFQTLLEWQLGLVFAYLVAAACWCGGRRSARRLSPGRSPPFPWSRGWRASFAGNSTFNSSPRYSRIACVRNFYGVVSVQEWDKDDPVRHSRNLRDGRIMHGEQFFAADKLRSDYVLRRIERRWPRHPLDAKAAAGDARRRRRPGARQRSAAYAEGRCV